MVKFEELDTDATSEETTSTPIGASRAGTTYDWSVAPDTIKAPPRIDLDGKTVTIIKADIILPSESEPWQKTKDGKKETKRCQFKLYYDLESQQEFLSGVRVFKSTDGKYSHPSFTRDRKNQASKMLGLYADSKKKDINDITLREFMGWLNSKPKITIKSEESTNPETGKVVKKNIPSKVVA